MEVLAPAELEQLLDILSSTAILSQTEAAFRAQFPEDRFLKTVVGLQFLRKEVGMLVVTNSHVETVNALFVLDCIRRSSSSGGGASAQEAAQAAKAAFFDTMHHLELLLREDARKCESTKYRATTKEGGAGSNMPMKRSSVDVTDAEAMRCRSAVKLFGLQCVAGKVNAAQSPIATLAMDQLSIDAALDAWQKNSVEIKETMNDIAHAAEVESERCSLGALSRAGVAGYAATGAPLQLIAPLLARPPLPQAITDVRYLHSNASIPHQLLFDGQWHSAEWRTAKELLLAAATAPLTAQQQLDATQSMTATTIPRLGVTASVMCSVTTYNPEIAAAVMNKVKDPSLLLEAVLASQAPADHIETVMLHCVKALRQIHVYKYVAGSIARVRAGDASSTQTKEWMVNLATTLHQLIMKFSKDNKELYINDNQKAELGRLFDEHAGVPEVASRWADLK